MTDPAAPLADARVSAAEATIKELRDKNEELAREAGRKDGVIEVLKENLREKQDAPPAAPVTVDLKPVLDEVKAAEDRIHADVGGKFDAVAAGFKGLHDKFDKAAASAPAPADAKVVVKERHGNVLVGILRGVVRGFVALCAITLVLVLLVVFWSPISQLAESAYQTVVEMLTHHDTPVPPGPSSSSSSAPLEPSSSVEPSSSEEPPASSVEPSKTCTLAAAVYVEGVGCVFPVPGE